jgi:CRP/FNR family transcriptional regulator, cyclic AMP receptor protein
MDIVDTLKESELFDNLSADHLEKLAIHCRDASFDRGSVLFHEGDGAKELYILKEGRIALEMEVRPVANRPAIPTAVEVISKNEIVGWSALVEPYVYTLSARCMTPCSTLAIMGDMFRLAMANDSVLGYEVMKHLSRIISLRLANTRLRLVNGMGIALLGREIETGK